MTAIPEFAAQRRDPKIPRVAKQQSGGAVARAARSRLRAITDGEPLYMVCYLTILVW